MKTKCASLHECAIRYQSTWSLDCDPHLEGHRCCQATTGGVAAQFTVGRKAVVSPCLEAESVLPQKEMKLPTSSHLLWPQTYLAFELEQISCAIK